MKEWKKVFLYAVVPAIIAGIFAVAPKLYDELTAPKAILEYSIARGPILKDGLDHKSIYAINVINNGSKPLSKINASIKSKGKIEALSIFESTGLSPEIRELKRIVSVETLHPNESFTISLMVVTQNENGSIGFVLRSKEALGTELIPSSAEKDRKSDLISGIGVFVAVFSMAISLLLRTKRGQSIDPLLNEKPNILFYIAAKFGFKDILSQYGISEGKITYLRFGDMLYAKGVNESSGDLVKTIMALKCMLLNSEMAEISRNSIVQNIKRLEGDEFSEEEINLLSDNSCDGSNLLKFRSLVDEYCGNPSAFLTKSDMPNK